MCGWVAASWEMGPMVDHANHSQSEAKLSWQCFLKVPQVVCKQG